MVRRLSAALVAWGAAAVAILVAVVAPDTEQPLSAGLCVLAALLGAIGALLLVRGLRHRGRRRRALAAAAAVTLARLDHLEPITTPAPLLRWRGDATPLRSGRDVDAAPAAAEVSLPGSAQAARAAPLRRPQGRALASSTTPRSTDTAAEAPRAR